MKIVKCVAISFVGFIVLLFIVGTLLPADDEPGSSVPASEVSSNTAPSSTKADSPIPSATEISESPTNTPEPVPTAAPVVHSFDGTGDAVLGPANITEGVLIVNGVHLGSRNFIVNIVGAEKNENSFNEIGDFAGSVAHAVSTGSLFGLQPGSVLIEVSADGPWSIKLTQEIPSGGQSPPIDWESQGQNVVKWLRFPTGNYVLNAQHQGSRNFQVFLLKSDGTNSENVINDIGDYSGENLLQVSSGNLFGMSPGLYALAVVADGDWSVSIK